MIDNNADTDSLLHFFGVKLTRVSHPQQTYKSNKLSTNALKTLVWQNGISSVQVMNLQMETLVPTTSMPPFPFKPFSSAALRTSDSIFFFRFENSPFLSLQIMFAVSTKEDME